MFGFPLVVRVSKFEELWCRLYAESFHMNCTMYVFIKVQDFEPGLRHSHLQISEVLHCKNTDFEKDIRM